VRLSASTEPMSGLGAPARTAIPILDLASGIRLLLAMYPLSSFLDKLVHLHDGLKKNSYLAILMVAIIRRSCLAPRRLPTRIWKRSWRAFRLERRLGPKDSLPVH
jgi:hypothetical protein